MSDLYEQFGEASKEASDLAIKLVKLAFAEAGETRPYVVLRAFGLASTIAQCTEAQAICGLIALALVQDVEKMLALQKKGIDPLNILPI